MTESKPEIQKRYCLRDLIQKESILLDKVSGDKWSIFADVANIALQQGWVSSAEIFAESLKKREKMQTTGIGDGIALPHGCSDCVKRPFLFIIISQADILFDSVDNQPVHLICLLGMPRVGPSHLPILSELTKILIQEDNRKVLMSFGDSSQVIHFFSVQV